MKFQDISLPEEIQKSLVSMGFETPTEIQEKAIPLVMSGKDIIAGAQTGTGKTAAFGIPMLAQAMENPEKTGLILAPTRELAAQILDVIRRLSAHTPHMTISMLIGGTSMQGQIRSLRKNPRVIVATPGRLMDHLQQKNLTLNNISLLVLDEADRMMDMGFTPQLEKILTYLPKERQTLFFSATVPPDIEKLAKKYVTNPVRLIVGPINQKVEKIEQDVREVTNATKNDVLMAEVKACEGSVLIFTRTRGRADKVSKFLLDGRQSVTRIHGDRSQGQRNAAIKAFRDGKYKILVATDIIARGLDIPHISLVVNYDLPQSPEDYIHRIGRTARAGAEGKALCLLLSEDKYQWARINKLYNPEVYKETLKQQQKENALSGRPNKYGKKKATDKTPRRPREDEGKAKRSFFSKRPGTIENTRWNPDDLTNKPSRPTAEKRSFKGKKKFSGKKASSQKVEKGSWFTKKFGKSKNARG